MKPRRCKEKHRSIYRLNDFIGGTICYRETARMALRSGGSVHSALWKSPKRNGAKSYHQNCFHSTSVERSQSQYPKPQNQVTLAAAEHRRNSRKVARPNNSASTTSNRLSKMESASVSSYQVEANELLIPWWLSSTGVSLSGMHELEYARNSVYSVLIIMVQLTQ